MKRGQAFDTMMLVISVLVALVILGILTTILNNINPEVNDPKALMLSSVQKIYTQGYGFSDAKEVQFKRETVAIAKGEVIGKAAINPSELAFGCGGPVCSGPLTVTDSSITINSDTKAFTVACGDDRSTQPVKYCVGVGRTAVEARTACTTKCRIT